MIFNVVLGVWVLFLICSIQQLWVYGGLEDKDKINQIEDKIMISNKKIVYLIMIPITIMAIISKFV